jgi:hypothetical protein
MPHLNRGKFNNALLLTEVEKKREHQSKSIAFRRNVLESQRRSNYINEYDRIKGEIEHRRVKHMPVMNALELRKTNLKQLAQLSLHGDVHDIFK